MKSCILILVMGLSSLCHGIGADKYAHASISYALSYTGMHFFPGSRTEAVLATIALGLVKEIADDVVDPEDLMANGVGIGFSVVIINLE